MVCRAADVEEDALDEWQIACDKGSGSDMTMARLRRQGERVSCVRGRGIEKEERGKRSEERGERQEVGGDGGESLQDRIRRRTFSLVRQRQTQLGRHYSGQGGCLLLVPYTIQLPALSPNGLARLSFVDASSTEYSQNRASESTLFVALLYCCMVVLLHWQFDSLPPASPTGKHHETNYRLHALVLTRSVANNSSGVHGALFSWSGAKSPRQYHKALRPGGCLW